MAYLAQAWAASVRPAGAIDPLTHHLPNVARMGAQREPLAGGPFAPLLANGNYPHDGDVLFLSVVLPWSNDAFVRPFNLAMRGVPGGVRLRAVS